MSNRPAMVKCLVWDLDNTLWKGTLLEGDDVVVPAAVREVITALDARGILQSVASKNDHDLAWSRLEELGLAEYFVAPEIGWQPKSVSVRAIAERLSFAPATIAFIDDLPAERAEVAYHLPEVRCYPAEKVSELITRPEFSPPVVTADSHQRRAMYQANQRREAERADFPGLDVEFLRSLELEMRISRATEQDLTRVEELTLRTSQMNATGVHYPDTVLRGLLAKPGHEVLLVGLSDRFGPHGAVGILLLDRYPTVWHLRLLATSCRVVSFGAGAVILTWLADQAFRAGTHLVADLRRTERNRIMEVAYRFAGYTDAACDCAAMVAGAEGSGVQRLHLEPAGHPPPATMRLLGPDLALTA